MFSLARTRAHTEWTGPAFVVYGHNAVRGLVKQEDSVGLDSGCVYGQHLSAYVLPEAKVVQVKARRMHSKPKRAIGTWASEDATSTPEGEEEAKRKASEARTASDDGRADESDAAGAGGAGASADVGAADDVRKA